MRASRTEARAQRHLRVRRKVHGTAERPRLAVFRSNRYIYAQVIDDDRGHTLASASSQEAQLRDRSLSVGTATEVGKLVAARAKEQGVGRVIFDRGGFSFRGRIRALAEAAREEGLVF